MNKISNSRLAFGFAVVSFYAVWMCSVGSAQTATTSAQENRAKNVQFKWLIVNNVNFQYTTTLVINGKPWGIFEKGSKLETKPLPFQEGKNQIKITFAPQANPEHRMQKASLKLLISPAMLPQEDSTVSIVDYATREGHEQIDISVTFKNGSPGKVTATRKRWLDADHKHLLMEMSADGDAISEDYDHLKFTQWSPEGKLLSESVETHGKLVTAKDYKPDGKLGAEVKNGEGVRQEYFEDGDLAVETPYHNGLASGEQKEFHGEGKVAKTTQFVSGKMEGPYKELDEQGVVRVSGTYKANEKDGVWTRYNEQGKEITRSTFQGGQLIKGDDRFF